MSCAERRDSILLLGAGLLEEAEAEELQAHLSAGCEACAVHTREAHALAAELLVAAEPIAPHPELRAELLRRVGRAPRTSDVLQPGPPPSAEHPAWHRLAIAAGVGALLMAAPAYLLAGRAGDARVAEIAAQHAVLAEEAEALRSERDELLAEIEEVDGEIVGLEGSLDLAREQIAMLSGPELQVIDLVGAGPQLEARARVFWNWDDYLCYLDARQLRPAPEGAVYALWLDTVDRGRLLVGTFRPASDGVGRLFIQLPRDAGEAHGATITLEPGAPTEAPRGPVQLLQAPS